MTTGLASNTLLRLHVAETTDGASDCGGCGSANGTVKSALQESRQAATQIDSCGDALVNNTNQPQHGPSHDLERKQQTHSSVLHCTRQGTRHGTAQEHNKRGVASRSSEHSNEGHTATTNTQQRDASVRGRRSARLTPLCKRHQPKPSCMLCTSRCPQQHASRCPCRRTRMCTWRAG